MDQTKTALIPAPGVDALAAHIPAPAFTAGAALMPEVLDADKFIANVVAWDKIRDYILSRLVRGKHFGKPKKMGASVKDFLFQSGASLIAGGFNVMAAAPEIQSGWEEGADHEGIPYTYFIAKARVPLVSRYTGQIVWEGFFRACSTTERRFQERMNRYGNLSEDFIEEVLRTAQKRSFIDNVRMFSGFNDRFSDSEDLVTGQPGDGDEQGEGGDKAAANSAQSKGDAASEKQITFLHSLGWDDQRILEECKKRGWNHLTKAGASTLIREGKAAESAWRRRPPTLPEKPEFT